MVLLDEAETSESEDGEPAEDYKGEIVGIHFQKKREGSFPKGYYLQTARIKADGTRDHSDGGKRIYTISENTHSELILASHNPGWTFLSSA